MLAVGFAVVWGLLGMWSVEVVEYVMRVGTFEVEALRFLTDGTPCISHRTAGEDQVGRYTDLEGKPITLAEDQDAPSSGTFLAAKLPERASSSNVSWEARISVFFDGRSLTTVWYLVTYGRPEGTAYFVAYDKETKTRIGYLGTAGFRDTPPPEEELIPFSGSAYTWGQKPRVIVSHEPSRASRQVRAPRGFVSDWDIYLLGRGGKMYHVDLHSRTMEVVFDDARLRSAMLLPDVYQANQTKHGILQRLAVRTEDTLLVLDEHGTVLRRYPIPEPGRGRDLAVMETSAGEAVMYWTLPAQEPTRKFEHQICWVKPDGQYRQTPVALTGGALFLTPTQMGIVLPSPLAVVGGIACFLAPNHPEELTYRQALAENLRQFWPALAIAQVLAAGLAFRCYRRQVRYGASRSQRIVWPLFVLLLGLPGWIGYRFGLSWPVLESCPDCGASVPRDRESCLRCTNDFPRPAMKGTEVFA
jgi:hypothetical protein